MAASLEDLGDESYQVWPAFSDLLAASAMLFLVLLAVVVSDRARTRGEMRTLRSELVAALRSLPDREQRLFTIGDDPQLVRIVLQEDVTFPTGRYAFSELKPEGRDALRAIGEILQRPSIDSMYQEVIVLGHTDQVPIRNPDFTNWELSAMRAAAIARLLVYEVGVDPCRLTASGAGPFFPRVPPEGVANRQENRRIEIEILPKRADAGIAGAHCDPAGDGTPLQTRTR